MRKIHLVLGFGVIAGALGIGVASAGESTFFAHNWGVTAAKQESGENLDVRLLSGHRPLSTETPWEGVSTTATDERSSDFHRARALDHQNPWGQGEIKPSLPSLKRGAVDEQL